MPSLTASARAVITGAVRLGRPAERTAPPPGPFPSGPVPAPVPPVLTRRCTPCDVTWQGTAVSRCWCCGGAATARP